MIKLCLISLGVLLDIYFGKYLLSLLWLWWVLFVVIAIYFIAKWVREE